MSESWIVGINPVEGALSNDAERVRELLVEHGQRNARVHELAERAKALKIPVHHRPREQLDKLAGPARHQGVVARYEAPPMASEGDLSRLVEAAGGEALVLVLDGVTDPHNLGACLRSAAAARATAVVVPKDRAVGLTPVVRRASAGGADRVPLVAVTNLARTLRELKEAGLWITGLAGDTGQSIYGVDLKGPVALVLGGEGEGMRRLTRELCDFVAKIPMPGAMESLNVSVATGIVLFEALRQRGSVR
ncbi:23S rRNA (guanosine(2251)-2'-O)-methyltransferase RlmB [Fulvimonas soli]|jgi:23S rRNA (guanosine2251-2'-O)-methyltransferase|uniref:23S rRNA (guanosine-2'-O-)-methyltransferase RlmB n=1 Tax=Fulvimonas soli TaxID=155197 RepID=A0A316HLN7_9GAMM|nr:23S rRNA (guanosine(2251)-2'-O)-methyltransferase RlmB [Fulvimonas soli]PWK81226.1 23S rRNA Gm-2251 2'-O-methyltransferase [Fulvimonas soli]TNY25587.1 23S rRNA (guanosine(2251)-2'-O)-methyltransferase RlmB [Fulvimonas soli]